MLDKRCDNLLQLFDFLIDQKLNSKFVTVASKNNSVYEVNHWAFTCQTASALISAVS